MLVWVIQTTIVATALSMGVLAVSWCWRLSPAVRHALWVVVLIKLLTPPLVRWPAPIDVSWPLPLADRVAVDHGSNTERPSPTQNEPSATAKAPTEVTRQQPELPSTGVTKQLPSRRPLRSEQPTRESTTDQRPARNDRNEQQIATGIAGPTITDRWMGAGLAVWIVGGCCVGAVQWIRLRRMRGRLRATADTPPELRQRVEYFAQQLGIRPPPIRVIQGLRSPLVWTIGPPQLLWPASLPATVPTRCWDGIIVHELAHLARRDHWVGWLELVGSCLWWFHPLFWYVRVQLRENRELACDAWVVGLLPEGRSAYAESVIAICESYSVAVAPLPSLGFGGMSRRAFERRLLMILRARFPWRVSKLGTVAMVTLALASIPVWSQSRKNGAAEGGWSVRSAQLPAQPAPSLDAEGGAFYGQPSTSNAGAVSAGEGSLVNGADAEAQAVRIANQIEHLRAQLQELRPPLSPTSVDAGGEMIRSNITNTVTLERTTYQLQPSRAEDLARFLAKHVDRDEVEVRVRQPKSAGLPCDLIVTATPQTQSAIAPFVRFLSVATAPTDESTYELTPESAALVPNETPTYRDDPSATPARSPAFYDEEPALDGNATGTQGLNRVQGGADVQGPVPVRDESADPVIRQ